MRRVLVLLAALLASSALLLAVDVPSHEPVAAKPCVPRHKPPCSTTTTRPSTTTTTRPATTTVPPTPPAGDITRVGRELRLNGQPYRFTGFNAYSLAADYALVNGCGQQINNRSAFFAALRPNSVVRFWAFAPFATNRTSGTRDWRAIDAVFNAAAAHGQRVLPVIANQWSECDSGAERTVAWYRTGYQTSLLPYLREIVTRYRNHPALAMWEVLNEPQLSQSPCPSDAAQVMRSFLDTTANEIKALDPNHLVSAGILGHGNCGAIGDDYRHIHAGSIDVVSYHDYQNDDVAIPGDQWNGMQVRIDQAAALNKPLLVGEVGIMAKTSGTGNCVLPAARRDKLRVKFDGQFAAGVVGILVWNWQESYWSNGAACQHEVTTADPTFQLVHDHPLDDDEFVGG